MNPGRKKLKICVIGWATSIHLQRFVRWFVERGHEIILITDNYCAIEGITQYEIGTPEFKNRRIGYAHNYLYYRVKLFRILSNIAEVRRILAKEKPDITHLHTLWFPARLGVFAGGKPLVVHPWNGDVIWTKGRSIGHSLLVRYALRKADAIPTQTEYLLDECVGRYGASSRKIRIIQFGVELDKFNWNIKEDRLKVELQLNADPVVISTRNIHYNVLNIIRAIPLVVQEIPNARFIFIWPPDNSLEKELRHLVDTSGIGDHVRLVGSVSREKIPFYLSISDAYVSVSLIDCFPQSLLEAMAMGLVPVVGDIPPIHVYLRSGHNAYFVKPDDVRQIADGIIQALKIDPATRKQYVERNRRIVEEKADFSKEMQKMEKLYRELISPGEANSERSPSIRIPA